MSAKAHIEIPLSPAAREIEAYVRQPIEKRQPVGYHREFLDTYRPNETFYLTQAYWYAVRPRTPADSVIASARRRPSCR